MEKISRNNLPNHSANKRHHEPSKYVAADFSDVIDVSK
jgi:hypothetical protein